MAPHHLAVIEIGFAVLTRHSRLSETPLAMKTCVLLSLLLSMDIGAQLAHPTKLHVNGVELHYIEQGKGEPVILLHGGQGDYRSWKAQIDPFSAKYRTISYSRRYHYPNKNPLVGTNHSALIEGADLAALIRKLELQPVHLVGTSYGAFAALAMALDSPELVRSLVLAEPPVHQWAKQTPQGTAEYERFMETVHHPVSKAFAEEKDALAMQIFVDQIAGAPRFEKLTDEAKESILQNSGFFKALMRSSDPYPNLSKQAVRQLKIPVLIVGGENTLELHKIVNKELAGVLPNAKSVTIPNARHASSRENPELFNREVLNFLDQLER